MERAAATVKWLEANRRLLVQPDELDRGFGPQAMNRGGEVAEQLSVEPDILEAKLRDVEPGEIRADRHGIRESAVVPREHEDELRHRPAVRFRRAARTGRYARPPGTQAP